MYVCMYVFGTVRLYALGWGGSTHVVAGIRPRFGDELSSSPVTAIVPELGDWGVTAAAQVTAAVGRVRRGPAP